MTTQKGEREEALAERMELAAEYACDLGCHGRCRVCPADALREGASALLSSSKAEGEMREALEPFANYYRHRMARPFRGLDDVIHRIHAGDEHEAAITLSDCKRAAAALSSKDPDPCSPSS